MLRKKQALSEEFDDLDVIASVGFGRKPLTKIERVEKVKQSQYLSAFPTENQQVLGLLLDEYVKSGTKELSKTELLQTPKFRTFGGLLPILNKFGGKELYRKAVKGLEKMIYSE